MFCPTLRLARGPYERLGAMAATIIVTYSCDNTECGNELDDMVAISRLNHDPRPEGWTRQQVMVGGLVAFALHCPDCSDARATVPEAPQSKP